jgi:hypothetical protein
MRCDDACVTAAWRRTLCPGPGREIFFRVNPYNLMSDYAEEAR